MSRILNNDVSKLLYLLKDRAKRKGMSSLVIITGIKGSGKSYLSLGFGSQLKGEAFTMEYVCFSLEQLFSLLNSKKLKPGDVVVLEEIGIAANSRDAMSRVNKHLSFISQAIRPARIILLVNTISWKLIDAQVRNMADFLIEVMGHDMITQETEFKFMQLKPNSQSEEPWREHLLFKDKGVLVKYISWVMKKAPNPLCEAYELKRTEYLNMIYSDALGTATSGVDMRYGRSRVAKKTTNKIDYEAIMIDAAKNINSVVRDGKVQKTLIALKYHISPRSAAFVKQGLESSIPIPNK